MIPFTNWDVGSPTNKTVENVCMEMSPLAGRSGRMEASEDGKWKDCRCSKRNLVVCEKKPDLTVPELQDILFKLREVVIEQKKIVAELTTNLTRTTNTVTELTINLTQLTGSSTQLTNRVTQLGNNPVPIGFIYVQLPSHPAPQTLWPNVQWRNVSPTYAGLFFRAEGGTAAGFGTLQEESCNRLIGVNFAWQSGKAPQQISLPAAGWSGYVMTGEDPRHAQYNVDGMRFQNSGAETRPKNKAVRIWERV
ncbi:uncharacterized protein LOC118438832 [Folsomia candida]|uniref:uncharacterized protein LOC118438832 n=1 Tax=Folsomia candida TaxID=158441 RepID=UPI001604ADD6|nr:uncharacterized protein LOC118438832 [Folsomia candida]